MKTKINVQSSIGIMTATKVLILVGNSEIVARVKGQSMLFELFKAFD